MRRRHVVGNCEGKSKERKMVEQLETLMEEFRGEYDGLQTQAETQNLKAKYLGKKGKIRTILGSMKDADPETRKSVGMLSNKYKDEIQTLIDAKLAEIEAREIDERLEKNWQDITLLDSVKMKGMNAAGFHPLSTIQREVEEIFLSMGFDILDGPHIEDDYHHFKALNVPENHPARDLQDTFWFPDMIHLLRGQTSTIQIRGMREKKPPFKFIGPGKVFRCEATDASHEMTFHQVEGMMIDKDVSAGNLYYFLKALLSAIFRREIEVRLRHGYFPFVEPGFELDIKCLFCGGDGCPVCKRTGWMEFLGCGMVHPNVLEEGGIDPDEWNGFAFGLGLDRLVMLRYGIDDIRHLQSGDLRFVGQFRAY